MERENTMLSCPNCGGNLKFDIPSQQLSCEHCHTLFDPYDFDGKTSDAEESKTFDGDYEVTIFTCPQCGGEILSTDNAAAGFCSFCGASTILYSRISHEKRPNYIIPFQKTKEQCKEAYARRMKHSIFAPKELRDPSYIDSFRGIYMPYWAFYISQKGSLSLNGKKTSRRGDYIITDHYALTGDLDAYYKGLSYDASSSFDDNISEELAPYNLKGMKAFTPAYLSGFYADTSDVDAKVYQGDAEYTASAETTGRIASDGTFAGFTMDTIRPEQLHTKTETIDSTMFPVWFLSYRKKTVSLMQRSTDRPDWSLRISRLIRSVICSVRCFWQFRSLLFWHGRHFTALFPGNDYPAFVTAFHRCLLLRMRFYPPKRYRGK